MCLPCAGFGRGDATIGNPQRTQHLSIQVVRAYPLMNCN